MDVVDGNDSALAAGIAVAATMQLFVCTQETSHVGTNRAHIVLINSSHKKMRSLRYIKARRTGVHFEQYVREIRNGL